jgi:hypothetical protein
MKTFYLLRHDDIHGNSGTGVVAEGIIFDSGMAVMTWLSEISTVTVFRRIVDVEKLHGHEGKTEVIVEGKKQHIEKFKECIKQVKLQKLSRERKNG